MTWQYTLIAGLALAAAFFWPRRGLFALWREGRELAGRMKREDVLKHILKCEANQQLPTLESISGLLQVNVNRAAELLAQMERQGLVSYDEGTLRLRPTGRELALHVVRAHRLWELYLAEQTGVAEDDWHRQAERKEHLLSPRQAEALAARLGHPTRDPHGDEIPEPGAGLAPEDGQPLNAVPVNTCVLIVHIEDEPVAVYAQLAAQGLRAGMKTCVVEKSPHRIRFWADGNEHVLAPILANNIHVAALPENKPLDLFAEETLSSLKPGQRTTVRQLSPVCRGPERRRLLDLGFVPGTVVELALTSPLGDPKAFRVRGTLVALRRQQSNLVHISKVESVAA